MIVVFKTGAPPHTSSGRARFRKPSTVRSQQLKKAADI